MRAWQISDSFSIDGLSCNEIPSQPPRPGEATIRVRAVSLNFRDLLVAKGLYSKKIPLPLTVCSDCAGEVAAVGEGATRFQPGDRVCVSFIPGWIDGEIDEAKARTALGAFAQGVLREELNIAESALVAFPEHLSWEEAATLPCAGVTAWNALVASGGLCANDWVLTQGSGGVSIFALQFAKALGARVIATSSSPAKLARLSELGADETIDYRATPDWEEAARKLTGGRGVDHVIEIGGAATFNKSVRAVRMGGRVSLIGNRAEGTAEPNLTAVLMKNVCVQGIFLGSRAMFESMNASVAASGIRPAVDRVFDFADAPAAFRAFETGGHFGKVCIRV